MIQIDLRQDPIIARLGPDVPAFQVDALRGPQQIVWWTEKDGVTYKNDIEIPASLNDVSDWLYNHIVERAQGLHWLSREYLRRKR